jgi:hypothetical protein
MERVVLAFASSIHNKQQQVFACTADCGKRVVFGDLLLHFVCELLFSFCTARDLPGLRGFTFTIDFCQRVVFGDLRSHLGCELWFSFCTRTYRANYGSVFVPGRYVLVQKLYHNSHPKCDRKSPKTTRLSESVVHLVCELLFSFCTSRDLPGRSREVQTFPVTAAVTVLLSRAPAAPMLSVCVTRAPQVQCSG